MDLAEGHTASRSVLFVHATREDRRLALEARMPHQQPGQLRARVPGNSHYRCLHRFYHDSSIVLNRDSTSLARRTSGQITNTVSSPATVPTTSAQPSWSRAAATGWAPPITVPTTTWFIACCTRRPQLSSISASAGGLLFSTAGPAPMPLGSE